MRESELSDALGSLVDRVEQTVDAADIKSRNVADDLKQLADRLMAVGEKLHRMVDASTASQSPPSERVESPLTVETGAKDPAVKIPAGGSKKPAGALVEQDDGDQDAPGGQPTEWDTYFSEGPSGEDAEQSAAADETDIFAPDEESPIDLTHDTDEERENVPVEQPSRQVDASKFYGLGWSKNESQADRSLSRLSPNLSEPPRAKTDLGLSGLPQQDVFPSPKPRGPKKTIDPVDHLIDSTDRLLNIDFDEIGNESDHETPLEPEEAAEEEMDLQFDDGVPVSEANITDDAEESKGEQQDASRDAKADEEDEEEDDGPRKRGGGRKALRIDSDDDEEPKETAGKTRAKKTIQSDGEQSGEEENDEEEDGSQAEESDRSESPEFNDQEADFMNFDPSLDDDDEAEEDKESPKGPRTRARANLLQSKSKKPTRPSSKRAPYQDTDDDEAIFLTDDEDEYKVSKKAPVKAPLKKRRKVVVLDSDPEAQSVEEEEEAPAESSPAKKKKTKLPTTLQAEREEKLRIQRLAEKQRAFNGIELVEEASDLSTSFSQVVEQRPRVQRVLLDPDTKGKPPHPVEVHPLLVRKLKPHQAEGVKFMFDSTIESLDRLRFAGGGCILSHVMGLGKTFQTITFLHTILTHSIISQKIRRVLIFVPKNVLLNWNNEFIKWLRHNDRSLDTIKVFKMVADKNAERLDVLKEWKNCKRPSVLIIGYELFRRLTQDLTINAKGKPRKMSEADKKLHKLQPEFRKYLQDPGADLVVLDEGHMLKNPKTALTQSMVKISTLRRIILSGTPMQNHLNEYHTMVGFVRPNLLGSVKEFADKFKNPIEKGRTKDADEYDVMVMKRTAHVLYKRLNKVLDRKDYDVLTEAIPRKQEYVVSCYCSDQQLQLYEHFINQIVNRMDPKLRRLFVVQAAHIVNRFTSHVYNLIENEKRKAAEKARKALKDFVVDEEEEVEDETVEDEEAGSEAPDAETPVPSPQPDWFRGLNVVSEEDKNKFETSAKLTVLAHILKECEEVLIFGQSLENLRLIQRMLEFMQKTWFDDHTATANVRGETWGWKKHRDFAMIDGSVGVEEREQIQREFNDIDNQRMRLCLISTKAGSLGTNFVGANRVVIFDLSWNPTHDQQALFRAYRFGQVKPVYVYRLASLGLESRRHYTNEDLEKMLSVPTEVYIEDAPKKYGPPEDKLLASVFQKCPSAIHDCWQHDSLLLNDVSEQLSPEERDAAWAEFEKRTTQSVFRKLPPNQRRFIQSCKNAVEGVRNALTEDQKNSLLVNDLLEAGCDMTEALALGCIFNLMFKSVYELLPPDQKDAYEELNDPHELIITMSHETKSEDVGVGTLLEVQDKCRRLHHILGSTGVLGDVFEGMEARIPGLLRDPPQPVPQARYPPGHPLHQPPPAYDLDLGY